MRVWAGHDRHRTAPKRYLHQNPPGGSGADSKNTPCRAGARSAGPAVYASPVFMTIHLRTQFRVCTSPPPTVMAAATTAITRTSMTPMTRRIAIRPARQWLQWSPRRRPCHQAAGVGRQPTAAPGCLPAAGKVTRVRAARLPRLDREPRAVRRTTLAQNWRARVDRVTLADSEVDVQIERALEAPVATERLSL